MSYSVWGGVANRGDGGALCSPGTGLSGAGGFAVGFVARRLRFGYGRPQMKKACISAGL